MKRLFFLLLALLVAACSSSSDRSGLPPNEASVRPGINDTFRSASLDIAEFTERFEGESREIATSRDLIVEALGLRSGMTVADVGAGTGLFMEPLAEIVGTGGKVYAVDISRGFILHLDERAMRAGLSQVKTVLCSDRSCELPARSVDLAFICDTYHHFEYPLNYMDSLYRAIRPGGSLVLVDFERTAQSSDWVLEHLRAGKETFSAEIETAGFELVEEIEVDGLNENYFLRFRRK